VVENVPARVWLPPGRQVVLPGRGRTFLRESAGPPGAPVLLLLHGFGLTADLNWFGAFRLLGEHFRVIAPDLRGHGRGPSGRSFRLDDCADDVAALTEVLGVDGAVLVGYSLGGVVAQLAWRRHPECVTGLVLSSTARNFRGSPLEKLAAVSIPGFAAVAQLTPMMHLFGSSLLSSATLAAIRDPALKRWAASEMDRTTLATAVAALHQVSEFSSREWIGSVSVPTAVMITDRDEIVSAARQRRLAEAIPNAVVHDLAGDHDVFVDDPELFAATLLAACRSVTPDAQRAVS
jgi:3-oxoadipate enol-lactonase